MNTERKKAQFRHCGKLPNQEGGGGGGYADELLMCNSVSGVIIPLHNP